MSGFVSKISAAGSRGWTGLQSLWERDNKAPLTASNNGPPQEKTSLLSLALPSRHPRGSRLLSEDDDCGDSPPEEGKEAANSELPPSTTTTHSLPPTPASTTATSSPRTLPKGEKPVTAPPTSEWSSFSEDEADMWMRSDSAHLGILDTDKKKSTRESKRPSPRFKHKTAASAKGSDWKYGEKERGFSPLGKLKGPSFGKLLDAESEEGGAPSSSGCENTVWADDDDDDDEAQWKMIEQRATPMSK